MAATGQVATVHTPNLSLVSRRKGRERWLSPIFLSPSIIAIFIFVYGFIGLSVWISMSNWGTPRMDLSLQDQLFGSYERIFNDRRFQSDLRNTIVFTVIFLLFAVAVGLGLAVLLDRHVFGTSVFRNVFLFPYALSFITTGVAWRWLFNPVTGINLLIEQSGLNTALGWIGLGPVNPRWLTNPDVVFPINGMLDAIGVGDDIKAQLGIPLAIIPITIAATWQLAGFAMAMYLAGLGTIPNEVREAAALDGASTWRMYRDIIIPLLTPITISILIILGHVSLKIFDLVYAMSGKGPGFATDVPGIYVFDKTFGATQYNIGAAASIVMLVLVSLIIVPYLARSLKEL